MLACNLSIKLERAGPGWRPCEDDAGCRVLERFKGGVPKNRELKYSRQELIKERMRMAVKLDVREGQIRLVHWRWAEGAQ